MWDITIYDGSLSQPIRGNDCTSLDLLKQQQTHYNPTKMGYQEDRIQAVSSSLDPTNYEVILYTLTGRP